MSNNLFDSMDRAFSTILLIILLNEVLYRLLGKNNKPVVLGGILSGIIFYNLHLPLAYFDIKSCSVFGDIGIVIFMTLIGLNFNIAYARKNYQHLAIMVPGILIPLLGGSVGAMLLYGYNIDAAMPIDLLQFMMLIILVFCTPSFAMVVLALNQGAFISHDITQKTLIIAVFECILFWIMFWVFIFWATRKFDYVLVLKAVTYILISFLVIKPFVKKLCTKISDPKLLLLLVVSGGFISASLASFAGLNQMVGGAIFGLLLPRNNTELQNISKWLVNFVIVLLLPIFFAQIGIVSNINLDFSLKYFTIALLLALLAVGTKFSGVFLGAKLMNYKNNEAVYLGSILNLRGIFEVAIIGVSYQKGLISLLVFKIVIIITVISTIIGAFLLSLVRKIFTSQ